MCLAKLERCLSRLCVLISLGNIYLFFVFSLHHKIENMPGSGLYKKSTKSFVTKYVIDIFPAAPLVAIVWPFILLYGLSASLCVAFASRERHVFSWKVYMLWITQMLLTSWWTFTFDHEDHCTTFILVTLIAISSSGALLLACHRSAIFFYDDEYCYIKAIPDNCRWWFNKIVINYFGVVVSWAFVVSFSSSLTYVIAFKNSYHQTTAEHRNIFSVETSGTISLAVVVLGEIVWIAAEYIYPTHFAQVTSVGPSATFFIFGIFLSNYDISVGLSTNNALCLVIGAISLSAMFLSNSTFKRSKTKRKHLNFENEKSRKNTRPSKQAKYC